MSKPNISTAAEQQRPLGFWFDRINNIVQLVTVKSNPTSAQVGKSGATLQVSVSGPGSATAIQVVNLGDLIQEDPFTSDGAANGNFLVHDHTSFSKRYSVLKLPPFGN
jgi:hypothetical protein